MRLILQARLEDEQTSSTATEATIVAVVERQERSVADLGLTLAEGRALLAKVQSVLVSPYRRLDGRPIGMSPLWLDAGSQGQPIHRDEDCVWQGRSIEPKAGKSVARIKAFDASLMARKGCEYSTLWWNLRRLYCHIDNNAATLVNYGARYHKGLPISSSIAESAVNQVVSHRMAKKQQMRWTDEGAHCLAQVRVAVLNGEFSVKGLAELAKMPCANSSHSRQTA